MAVRPRVSPFARLFALACTPVFVCVASTGCVETPVSALVTWFDSEDTRGVRQLQVYDHGRRYAVPFQPEVEGAGFRQVGLAVNARGLGIAVRGQRTLEWLGLTDTRRPQLRAQMFRDGVLPASFAFTRNQDALLSGALLMPLTGPSTGMAVDIPRDEGAFEQILTASAAPVIVRVSLADAPRRASGTHEAFAYPSAVDPGALVVDRLTPLGNATFEGGQLGSLQSERRIGAGWCPSGVCVSPDGRSVTSATDVRCGFWWWRWQVTEAPLVLVEIEQGCPPVAPLVPIAQLDHDVLLLEDEARIFVANLSSKSMVATPKLGRTRGRFVLTDLGRVAVLIDSGGRVVRADADGTRIVSAESTPCAGGRPRARVSPNGLWVMLTCSGDGSSFSSGSDGVLVRVSPEGVERFTSVPMEPLAIDDGGTALLYSRTSTGEPRALFVLTPTGVVSRIDPLEPEPQLLESNDAEDLYIASGQLWND